MQALLELAGEMLVPQGWQAVCEPLFSKWASAENSLAILETVYPLAVPTALCFQGEMDIALAEKITQARLEREKGRFRHHAH